MIARPSDSLFWPDKLGPILEKPDPDQYILELMDRESSGVLAWRGRGAQGADAVSACGVFFAGYLRKHEGVAYVVLVYSAEDKQPHALSWIPAEYRLGSGPPTRFARRRDGSKILPALRYLDSLPLSEVPPLVGPDRMRVYLPWIDECPVKPALDFQRDFTSG